MDHEAGRLTDALADPRDREQQDGCGNAKLSRANGALHGQDTIAKCETEGFPRSTIVFLDVENFDGALSTDMGAYISGWIGALLDEGSVRPGIYCPARKAAAIQALAAEEYLAHGIANGSPAFWIVKVDPEFDPASSAPAGCGVAFIIVIAPAETAKLSPVEHRSKNIALTFLANFSGISLSS